MERYKIIIQYDGTKYSGFQSQKNKNAIQDKIETSLSFLNNNNKIRIHSASRTDAGVHALGQVAHFDLGKNISIHDIKKAINARLDKEIRIVNVEKVKNDFHSRYDAIGKQYVYKCTLSNNPLLINHMYSIKNIDIEKLNNCAKIIIGKHDFLSFSKFSDKKNNFCTINQSFWEIESDNISYFINGDRFLHHMVRYLVGTMIAVSQDKISLDFFESLLFNPSKDAKIYKSPAKGLFLNEVFYKD